MLQIPGDESGDVYLSTAEVAELLQCTRGHVSTLRSRAARGEGPELAGFRFGRSFLTRRSSVRAFLEGLEDTDVKVDAG
jgi:hypothetical protein